MSSGTDNKAAADVSQQQPDTTTTTTTTTTRVDNFQATRAHPTTATNDESSSISSVSEPRLFDDKDQEQQEQDIEGTAGVEAYEPDAGELGRVESTSRASRTLSRALTDADEIEAEAQDDTSPIPPMGLNKQIPEFIPPNDDYTVSFNGDDDPLHPHNWPSMKKIIICVAIGFNTASIAWGSSAFSTGTEVVAAEFGVSTEVVILGTSLYVLGFATGPVIWAPLSEIYGRRMVLLLSTLGFTLFQFAVATATNIQTIIICRFFGGVIGAAPLVVVPAAFADLFNGATRGRAITIFSMTVFTTPIIAPVCCAFIVNSYLGWRWIEYITGIMGAFALVLTVFIFEETHHPIILVQKADYIRKRTGNWAIHAPHDEFTLTVKDIVEKNITRPLRMLVTEPIILLISLYNAFIYGILYLLLSAYPIVFAEGYGMTGGVAELPYIAVALGMVLGGLWCMWAEKLYLRDLSKSKIKILPESRLYAMFPGAIAFPIGLLWFTWTGNYHNTVHWMAPTAAGLFIGFGLITIFNASINYIIDSYLMLAASAMAANAFLRASFACAFPLFGTQMFHNMGTNWAGLLLACIGFVLTPVPFLFFKYGKTIRKKSKMAFAF